MMPSLSPIYRSLPVQVPKGWKNVEIFRQMYESPGREMDPPRPRSSRHRNGLHIMKVSLLIADSDGSLASVFRRYLPTCYEVDTAHGGIECLSKLRNWAPDVLVLADCLPWGGADGVLAQMREDARLCEVPVVLITDGDHAERLARLMPPVVDRLARPFPLTQLLDRIRAAAFPSRNGELKESHRCAL
jgi:DNA-binding NtrC family response regulator